jgi:hypothetical protein
MTFLSCFLLSSLSRLARITRRLRVGADAGMSTAEYAVGTVAPVGRLIRSQRPVFTGLHCVLLRGVRAAMAA